MVTALPAADVETYGPLRPGPDSKSLSVRSGARAGAASEAAALNCAATHGKVWLPARQVGYCPVLAVIRRV